MSWKRWVVVLLAMGSLAACDSGGKSATPTTSASPLADVTHRTAAACVLVQQREATLLFGRAADQVEVPNTTDAASVCAWKADTNPDPNAVGGVTYSLLIDVYDDTGHYSESATAGAQHLDGLGEKAFTFQAADLVTVEFLAKGQTVLLHYSITSLAAHPDPGADLDRLVALARQAVARM